MRRQRTPALGFVFVTLTLDILGLGLIIPILPKLIESYLGGNVAQASHIYGLLAALYALMQFLFAPLLGSLSDRFGRRPVILASLFGSGLDYFFLAFAPNLAWFFAGRIVAGITGANFAAATAYIADVSPPEKRAANFGLVGAAFGLGFILGPALGGLLGGYGLHLPFLVAGGLTLINCLYGWFVLPESLAVENRRTFSWGRSNPVGALLALRRHPVVGAMSGIYFLIYLAHQVFPATWVLYTGYRYHWSIQQTGLSLAVVGVMSALVQGILTRKLIPRLGERGAILLGLTISSAGYAAFGLVPEGWMIYPLMIFNSLSGIAGPAVQGLISRDVGADEQGGVQGALSSLASVTGIIGPPLATTLFAFFVSPTAPAQIPGIAFFFSSVLSIVAVLLTWRMRRGENAAKSKRANFLLIPALLAVVLLLIYGAIDGIAANIAANGLLHPARRRFDQPLPANAEAVEFAGAGVTIRGWRFPAQTAPPRGTLIYLHGISDNRGGAVNFADHFTKMGFSVLACDCRAHGASTGDICTYGWMEKEDLHHIVDALPAQKVVLFGKSLGAAIALQEAGDDARITGVIAVETFSDLRTVATERAPAYLTSWMIEDAFRVAENRANLSVDAISPVKAAARIKVPVLLIHGERDVDTRPAHSERVYAALAGPREWILVPEAAHNQSLNLLGWEKVDAWLDRVFPR